MSSVKNIKNYENSIVKYISLKSLRKNCIIEIISSDGQILYSEKKNDLEKRYSYGTIECLAFSEYRN